VRLPDGPIRQAGEYKVVLHLHTDVDSTAIITIIADEDVLPHIFTRFYRNSIPVETTSKQQETGLGLVFAARIVELHGSMLSVESMLR